MRMLAGVEGLGIGGDDLTRTGDRMARRGLR